MSSRRMVAIGLVALLHAIIGYAFITGLAYNVIKKTVADLKTFDVEEAPPPPPEKPPPPPPEQKVEPPPMVVPPPIVQAPVTVAPPIVSTPTPPPAPVITPAAPPASPPPPAPKLASPAQARGNPSSWVTSDDYPSRALREEKEGVTSISFTVTPEGKAADCKVTASSGTPELDETTCSTFVRRARYKPAVDDAGHPIAQTMSQRVRWQIPKE